VELCRIICLKRILLIITGSIAAYKALDLIRELKRAGYSVTPVLTAGAKQFVTSLSVASLCESHVYDDLWSLKDEVEMGHIRLSRECDLIVVAPASADFIAKIASGRADDLASSVILASDKKIMLAPTMNPQMWAKPSTQRNIKQIDEDGVIIIPPEHGEMACGEVGTGRFPSIETIIAEISGHFNAPTQKPLQGLKAIVTAGATIEAIDPVRYISNHSSGKQGYAVADELQKLGARVTVISGNASAAKPDVTKFIKVESALQMLEECRKALPADIAIFCAAVADWRVKNASVNKIKKTKNQGLSLDLVENPDILSEFGLLAGSKRPSIVIGFAAESENLLANAQAKLSKKGADFIVGNLIQQKHLDEKISVFGADLNHVHLISRKSETHEDWGVISKKQVAQKLALVIVEQIKHRNKPKKLKTGA
jgi:phosphopantothenoylcysteine decarboxylase/phosphopantothenate--cysteine ligase